MPTPLADAICNPPCCERERAMETACFVFDDARKAYVMPDLKPRRMRFDAKERIEKSGKETFDGEPFTWTPGLSCCPWCARLLPVEARASESDAGGWR